MEYLISKELKEPLTAYLKNLATIKITKFSKLQKLINNKRNALVELKYNRLIAEPYDLIANDKVKKIAEETIYQLETELNTHLKDIKTIKANLDELNHYLYQLRKTKAL